MACILNKPKIILPANLPDLVDRTRLPRVINVDYRAGFRADPPPYLIWVDIPRYRVDISKDRNMTVVEDSITRGGKGEGGCNDLTPFREVNGLDRDIQSARAAVHRDRVPRADVSGKIRLKQIDGRPRREPFALQNLYDRSDIIIIDGLMPIRNETSSALPYCGYSTGDLSSTSVRQRQAMPYCSRSSSGTPLAGVFLHAHRSSARTVTPAL